MHRGELLHRTIELGQLVLDRVELAARVQLAAERVAEVVHATRRAMGDVERAAAGTAERAAGMVVARRCQIARAGPGMRERRKLVVV